MKGCFVSKDGSDRLNYVYKMGRREKFEKELEVLPGIVTEKNLDQHKAFLRETEVIITTWNFVPFTDAQIGEYFPKLRLVLYGAGSVQGFARPFLNRGIRVVSGWVAMSVAVTEYASSQVLLANKGYFQALLKYRNEGFKTAKDMCSNIYPGNFETRVGILGAGMIGAGVAKRLQESNLEILAYDPYLSDEKAKAINVKKVSIEEVFSTCQTITNHMAHNPQTQGMLNYRLFNLMGDYAVFVNTARGASVVEADLLRALKEKPTRTAVLDVTWPEPAAEGSELLSLPNVFLTPHIAGYANHEVLRLADYMFDELKRFKSNEKLLYEVTLPMLETMA
ncbi:MAG: hydroxyacid dehydrogenase [Treponema sp.]|nr:hydroxyacid dehydrogenase [Treponema sp.]